MLKQLLKLLLFLSPNIVFAALSLSEQAHLNCIEDKFTSVECDIRFSPAQKIKTINVYTDNTDLTLSDAEAFPYKDSRSIVLFLVDTSDRRRTAEIEQKKQHIKYFINNAKAYESFGLSSFDSDINIKVSIGSSKQEILRTLNTIVPTGRTTELYRNTIQAMRQLNNYDADRKTLIVLSDGQAEDTAYFHQDVIDYAKENNIIISAIGYPRTVHLAVALQSIRRLAEETGGGYYQTELDYSLDKSKLDSLLDYSNNGANINIDITGLNDDDNNLNLEIITTEKKYIKQIPITLEPKKKEIEAPATTLITDTKAATSTKDTIAPKVTLAPQNNVMPINIWLWYGIPLAILFVIIIIVLALLWSLRDRKSQRYKASMYSVPTIRPYAYLIIQDKNFTRHPIKRTVCRVGRSSDNELSLNDNSVSRRHAEIHRLASGDFEIIDLNSTNGVYVNQQKIRHYVLEEADIIEIGDILLRFTFISAEDIPEDATAIQNTKAP